MIIALFPNTHKPESNNLAVGIREFLTSRGVKVVAEDEDARLIGATPLSEVDPASIDFSFRWAVMEQFYASSTSMNI